MVATKLSPPPTATVATAATLASSATSNNNSYEIRSGMSVQDLKQLTAQRAQRQRMEYWDLQARNSPRDVGSWSFGVSSSSSGSSADSPPRQYVYTLPGAAYAATAASRSSSSHYGAHYYPARGSPALSPSGEPERMFVTCGGQVVSFMEGVVNAPQFDFLPEMLNATL